MSIIDSEANKFKDLISGARGGVSAFDDPSLFPKTGTLDDLNFEKRKNTKPVKVSLGHTQVSFDEIFGKQSTGDA